MVKLVDTLSKPIQDALATEHQKALAKLMHNRTFTYVLPMHEVPMRLWQGPHQDDQIQTIILPALSLYIDQTKIDGDHLSRDAIEYRIATNNQSLPVSHIYRDSGWICLGNLFVPSMISKYSPQQPLETLLLANDRNLAHGNPTITLTKGQVKQLNYYLKTQNIDLTSYEPTYGNWVKHDTLWKMSHEVWQNYEHDQAFAIMTEIYAIVFQAPLERPRVV